MSNIRQKGQVIILVTLALIAMCGILGLAIDLGWSFFVKKHAQAAADSAALAAVIAGRQAAYGCGTSNTNCGTTDGAIVRCSSNPPLNLMTACQFAANSYGFVDGTDNVSVSVAASYLPSTFHYLYSTTAKVDVQYWVTVRVARQVPQLFSAVLGNSTGLVAARASAAMTRVVFNSSLQLLNRQADPAVGINPLNPGGVDLVMTGGGGGGGNEGGLVAPQGIYIASSLFALNPLDPHAVSAAMNKGSYHVSAPFTDFLDTGACVGGGKGGPYCQDGGVWSANWQNYSGTSGGLPGAAADGQPYYDPTAGEGQPPLNTNSPSTTAYAVLGGAFGSTNIYDGSTGQQVSISGNAYPSGQYYASDATLLGGKCTPLPCHASGAMMTFPRNVQFGSGSSAEFGQFVFYGGLDASNTTIKLSPGVYVFAGALDGNPVLRSNNQTSITDIDSSGSAGELLIYTNADYNWAGGTGYVSGSLRNMLPLAIQNYGASDFKYGSDPTYGSVNIKEGNCGSNCTPNLQGLNQSASTLPSVLKPYSPFLMWQDRGNSTIAYDSMGNIVTDVSCGGGGPGKINQPCLNTGNSQLSPTSPMMSINAGVNIDLKGVIYQPRGSLLALSGSGNFGSVDSPSPLQIVAGALNLSGGGQIVLKGIGTPMTVVSPALIE